MPVQCGHVYHLDLLVAGKPKLIVPAFVEEDGRVRYFVINSQRTRFQAERAEISKHVLPLHEAENAAYLKHDSWLTCHEVVGGPTADEIEAAENCYRGILDPNTLAAVRALIKDSRLHSEADKAAILATWPEG